jgi:hypothetical protein
MSTAKSKSRDRARARARVRTTTHLNVLSDPPVAVVKSTLMSLTSIGDEEAPSASREHVAVKMVDQRIVGRF